MVGYEHECIFIIAWVKLFHFPPLLINIMYKNKFHNDGVTKVVTPHSYELNFLTPHL